MVDPKISITRTLKHEDAKLEGKVTSDTGGLTRWGISQKTYKTLDIRNLSLEKAIEIYKKDYFSKMRLERVKDQEVADAIFDYGVNAGINRAMVTAREAAIICMSGFKSASYIAEANIYDLINASNVKIFLETFVDLRKKYYISLATRNATKYEKYLKGWLRRADTYLPKKEINT